MFFGHGITIRLYNLQQSKERKKKKPQIISTCTGSVSRSSWNNLIFWLFPKIKRGYNFFLFVFNDLMTLTLPKNNEKKMKNGNKTTKIILFVELEISKKNYR